MAPDEPVDPDRANVARMYDYYLGGSHNFAVDRELAHRATVANPELVAAIQELRSFLRRAVVLCVERGVDQFLDLGSGIPTAGNVHEVARRHLPGARVAYVDHDPVAAHHSRTLLSDVDGVTIVQGDLLDPDAVLSAPEVTEVLDFDRPVAVLMFAVLHFLPDDLVRVIGAYRRALAPGSALALSHVSVDWDDPELVARTKSVEDVYRRSAQPVRFRDRTEIAALFGDAELVPPGLVDVVDWRPDRARAGVPSGVYGGVGFLPTPDGRR